MKKIITSLFMFVVGLSNVVIANYPQNAVADFIWSLGTSGIGGF